MPRGLRCLYEEADAQIHPRIPYAPCILHDILQLPSSAGRVRARLSARKSMIDLFRHKFLGPLATIWLVVTVVSVVIGAVAWSRFSANVDAAAQTEEFRHSMNHIVSALQNAEVSQRNYLLTGKEGYLNIFTNAENTFPKEFDRLAEFVLPDHARRKAKIVLSALLVFILADLSQCI